MSLLAYLDSFNVTTGAIGTNYARTGQGFTGKAFMGMLNGYTGSADSTARGNARFCFGMATGTAARWNSGFQTEDTVATSNCDKMQRDDSFLSTLDTAGVMSALLDLGAVGTDGPTWTVDDVFPDTPRCHILSLGGIEITNVALGVFDQATATGNSDITTVGFQPDFVQIISCYGTAPEPSVLTGSSFQIAACDAALNQWVMAQRGINASANADTGTYFRSGQVIGVPNSAATITGCLARASITSMLSNGFRLNYAEADAVVRRYGYLAIKGGNWKVGTLTTQTDTVTAIAVSAGFKPSCGLIASIGAAESADDTPGVNIHSSIGMFTSDTHRVVQGVRDTDGSANMEVTITNEEDEVYCHITASAGTVDGLMDIQTIQPKGFNAIMDDADSSGFIAGYWAAGSKRTGVVGIGHLPEHR